MTAFVSDAMRQRLIEGVHEAGRRVLEIYHGDYSVETKDDNSPVTDADMAAHFALVALLEAQTPGTPVLSEESQVVAYSTRQTWQRYWLIDPLDGTKEFIKRSGEFTQRSAGGKRSTRVWYRLCPCAQSALARPSGAGRLETDRQ